MQMAGANRVTLTGAFMMLAAGCISAGNVLAEPVINGSPAGLNQDLLNLFVQVPGASIVQSGSNNRASITQSSGGENFSFIGTTGSDNEVTIIQRGEGHAAGAMTIGSGSTVDINQQGRDHQAAIAVFGNNADISVTQRGASESVGIVQFGKGSPVDIKQGY